MTRAFFELGHAPSLPDLDRATGSEDLERNANPAALGKAFHSERLEELGMILLVKLDRGGGSDSGVEPEDCDLEDSFSVGGLPDGFRGHGPAFEL